MFGTRPQVVDATEVPVVSRDNLMLALDLRIAFQVDDRRTAKRAGDLPGRVVQRTSVALREVVGSMDTEQVVDAEAAIGRAVLTAAVGPAAAHGVRIDRVDVVGVHYPAAVEAALRDRDARGRRSDAHPSG